MLCCDKLALHEAISSVQRKKKVKAVSCCTWCCFKVGSVLFHAVASRHHSDVQFTRDDQAAIWSHATASAHLTFKYCCCRFIYHKKLYKMRIWQINKSSVKNIFHLERWRFIDLSLIIVNDLLINYSKAVSIHGVKLAYFK